VVYRLVRGVGVQAETQMMDEGIELTGHCRMFAAIA
jgi:hypothetical protein